MLSLTDTSSASTYGLQTARLSRSGDNGPDRTFIAPDAKGLSAGLAAMVPGKVPGVLEPAVGLIDPKAYPLTTINYAAVAPLALDAQARSEYAAFLEYATGAGQVSGRKLGQLPPGYVPLNAELASQGAAVAQQVRTLQPAAPAPAPTPTTAAPAAQAPVAQTPAPTASRSVTRSRTTTIASAPAPATETPSAVPTETPAPTEEVAVEVTKNEVEVTSERAVVATPSEGVSPVGRVAVPVLGVMALASALLALELTKRPRRSLGPDAPVQDGP